MNICRFCISGEPDKDLSQLETYENGSKISYVDIIKFCLDIQVTPDSVNTTKLCLKCFENLLCFYEFKSVALKNDEYLKSIQSGTGVKNEVFIRDCSDIKLEIIPLSEEDFHSTEAKDDIMIKKDDNSFKEEQQFQSDDELLSVIKNIKYEYAEGAKENAPIKKKKGRMKKNKLETGKSTEKQVCVECGLAVRNLKEHLYRHLPEECRKRIKCHLCDKTFASHSARYKHNIRKHLATKAQCKICDKYVFNLRQHQLVVHETDSLPYKCAACDRRFISNSRLELHATIHTKNRAFECDVCQKRFRARVTMLLHKRQVHDQEKSHLCQFCSKSFFKKYHLQQHLRTHTKEKPHECPDCGKFFSSKNTLKIHRQIHSAVKMYECTLCDMSFAVEKYLRSHMLIHTKEKRYPCKYCGLKFGRSDHARRHERTAHERCT